ncbi:MAG: amidohydrolase [Lachnospiraceae bacterium]
MFADVTFVNGKIYTMKEEGDVAEAFAVRDGKFIFTGSNEEAEKIISEKTIDLKGRTVYPGFIDCHQHTLAYARTTEEVNLCGTRSVEEVLERLREKKSITPKGQWIKGSGFNHEQFSDVRIPTREELDSVSTEHPILISRYCMHVHAANSMALDIAGIDEDFLPEVPNSVEKDDSGKLNGILRESAVTPVLHSIPDMLPTYEDKKEGLYRACCEMNSYGITGIHPIQGKFVDADEYLNLYQDLEKEGRLTVRVYISFDEYPSFNMKTGFGNEKIRYGFYKIYSDGSLGSRNAALSEPYCDKPDSCGLLNHSPEEIKELCHKAYDMDLQIGIHAIGDKGVEIALDAIEECYRENPKPDARFRLIHAIVLRKDLIERIKKLPVIVDIQPRFTSNYNIWWSEDRLGPERIKYAYAWNTLVKEGIMMTGSSDSPVEPFDPFLGIYSVVCRQDLTEKPENGWYPKERLSVYDALCLYTKNAAYSSYEENIKGTIETGKLADFVVADQDIFEIRPQDIRFTKVLQTYLGGEEIYKKS